MPVTFYFAPKEFLIQSSRWKYITLHITTVEWLMVWTILTIPCIWLNMILIFIILVFILNINIIFHCNTYTILTFSCINNCNTITVYRHVRFYLGWKLFVDPIRECKSYLFIHLNALVNRQCKESVLEILITHTPEPWLMKRS